jgi:hypothetical protein
MAVTSDQLLAFIEKAVTVETMLDADGQVLMQTEPRLEGEALANAIKHVAELSCHEAGIGFAIQQYEDQHQGLGGRVVPFGPRAN